MSDKNKIAGAAGIIYLLVIVTGIFSLAYVPLQLIDWNNAGTTFSNISRSTGLFSLGIFSSVVCYVAFIFLPLVLYRLLHTVHAQLACVMVILALLSVPLSLINLQHKFAALSIVEAAGHLKDGFSAELQNQLMFELQQYNNGLLLATVFWGLWLFPLGMLAYRSGFMPKLLGILLMAGCTGYLINFTGNTLIEDYKQTAIRKFAGLLPSIAEISTCIWLLVAGLKTKKV
ncbi:MAG: DUF4386 domain-containing protein [Chitinophagales bacterium]|nr:DUF4386 domain-containing protein [Chitinophagales bacterium]